MTNSIEAVVLAGGRGERMGALTDSQQKCLLKVGGQPILGNVIESLVQAFGSVDLKIAVSYQAEAVMYYVNYAFLGRKNLSVAYIPHQLGAGTLGAYRTMISQVRDRFVGLPGDVLVEPLVYSNLVTYHDTRTSHQLDIVVTNDLDFADTHGVVVTDPHRGVVENILWPPKPSDLLPKNFRDMNIYAMELSVLDLLEKFSANIGAFTTFVQIMLADKHIDVGYSVAEGQIFHIAYPRDLVALL